MAITSTTVEITIGYLTTKARIKRLISTTVEITIGYLTYNSRCSLGNLQQ